MYSVTDAKTSKSVTDDRLQTLKALRMMIGICRVLKTLKALRRLIVICRVGCYWRWQRAPKVGRVSTETIHSKRPLAGSLCAAFDTSTVHTQPRNCCWGFLFGRQLSNGDEHSYCCLVNDCARRVHNDMTKPVSPDRGCVVYLESPD